MCYRGGVTVKLAVSHLNLHQVDGLHEPGLGRELTGVQNPAGRGNDLATAAVDGVCVEGHVMDVETDTTHVLLAQHTLSRETKPSRATDSAFNKKYTSEHFPF